ncbi:TPA: 4-hydroxybenzoate octaprenyltransferase [Neisseria meningitidis]|uniref:4-hydroxybenzoate octaprenyltransferase n=1 Tax=Neisseria meningitidis TaxID=487 RepID=UPI0007665820|nr:4-hydroxybenzoate octaprenyltransferase [Neisseria meningitidis]CWM70197.1 4-hydroxybenzoate octaprenyltransferase [Neisseria meningitidis]CWP55946.1 4-hydroxybenzoate octaprenyltransferase [Neisseria meningitidis]CWQ58873.1 4-hydroxybenzoate octaprenyltransferase [Neisseria meningitidis]CWT22351.1 4-hydroxybenzoate octaprenyltransferase [Neisseria meningitidis]
MNPKSPLFLRLSDRLDVYLRLMRADKPIGTLLLLWPTYWALWLASDGIPDWTVLAAFTIGTFLMRSAGCVINDFADRDFDGAVERTKNRPFAQGRVGKKEALLLTAFLCLLAALCLIPLNHLTWLMSLPALFLALTYPFTKRFFPIPQFYLGLAFSFGIPMAFAAVVGNVPFEAWILFAANVLWTLAYDTVYAMADKEDDLKIGIKTSAVTFGRYDIVAAMLCHGGFTLLMVALGIEIGATWAYWAAVPVTVWLQSLQYRAIKNRNRQVCFQTFLANNRIGQVWFLAIFAHAFLMAHQ